MGWRIRDGLPIGRTKGCILNSTALSQQLTVDCSAADVHHAQRRRSRGERSQHPFPAVLARATLRAVFDNVPRPPLCAIAWRRIPGLQGTCSVNVSHLYLPVFRIQILTFILERHIDIKIKKQLLTPAFLSIVGTAQKTLNQKEGSIRGQFPPASIDGFGLYEADGDAVAKPAIERFVVLASGRLEDEPSFTGALLHIFTAHLLLLPKISVAHRARPPVTLSSELDTYLRETFLPAAFLALERVIIGLGHTTDVDGRVFLELVCYTLKNRDSNLQDVIGADVFKTLDCIWTSSKQTSPDYMALRSQFSALSEEATPISIIQTAVEPLTVLPFSNPVFDKALSSIQVAVARSPQVPPANSGFGVPFVDDRHWHNHERSVLPKRLGGSDPVQTERERKRRLRSAQRFIAKMQWQAESLTGASGKTLQRIAIVTGESGRTAKRKSKAEVTVSSFSSAHASLLTKIIRPAL